jgi:HPt (histidine-containing phosphotransfer) domain-containing protein
LEKHYHLDFLKDYYQDDLLSMNVVLKLYLEETPKDLEHIELSLRNNNAAEAKAATHKIKTNIAMLGIQGSAVFLDLMHELAATADVTEEVLTVFMLFKSEVLKGLNDIKNDYFKME